MAWELKTMKARHKLIIDLHLAGLKNTEIAEEMDNTAESVGMILRSPIVQEELARRRYAVDKVSDQAVGNVAARAKEILAAASANAAQLLVDQIDHQDPRVAQNAALSILEESFGTKSGGPAMVVNINTNQLALLQQTLSECAA